MSSLLTTLTDTYSSYLLARITFTWGMRSTQQPSDNPGASVWRLRAGKKNNKQNHNIKTWLWVSAPRKATVSFRSRCDKHESRGSSHFLFYSAGACWGRTQKRSRAELQRDDDVEALPTFDAGSPSHRAFRLRRCHISTHQVAQCSPCHPAPFLSTPAHCDLVQETEAFLWLCVFQPFLSLGTFFKLEKSQPKILQNDLFFLPHNDNIAS